VFRLSVPAVSGIRWGTVTAVYSLRRLEAQFDRTRLRLGVSSVVLFVLLGAILYVGLDRLVVRPVRTLQQAVRRMGEGQLTTRVPPLRGSELGELTNTINRMASALQHERDNLERAVTERTKELQDANARLERLAVTDGLTGVFNHRRFQEQLQAEILRSDRHKRPLSVLMIDVDFFKKVNDALGHPAGDELLRRLAEVLSADLRQTDLIARYGGEEFAVLLPETSKTEAVQVAERMRQAVESQLNGEGAKWPVRITVSIGVATFPEEGPSGEQVLVAADQAMYVAKRQGRNRVIGARGVMA
jgi:diguanylate cyclase (GGDEF)-like protein